MRLVLLLVFMLIVGGNLKAQVPQSFQHKIERGESLESISTIYEVPLDSVLFWNHIAENFFKIDYLLQIKNLQQLSENEVALNKLKLEQSHLEQKIAASKTSLELMLAKLNERKLQVSEDDPFAMQEYFAISKLKKAQEDSINTYCSFYFSSLEKNASLQNKYVQLIEEERILLAQQNEARMNEETTSLEIPEIVKEEDEQIAKKKSNASKDKKDNTKQASGKETNVAQEDVPIIEKEALKFDSPFESKLDSSTKNDKKIKSKLLKELTSDFDSSKAVKNIIIDEVQINRTKNKTKYKLGDEVDAIRQDKAKFFLSRAMVEIDKKNYPKAKEYINKSLDLNPSYMEAYMLLGDMYASFGYYDKALNEYKKADKLNGNIAQLHYNMGNCLIYLNKMDDALISMSKAIRIDTSYILAYSGRASIYIEKEIYSRALKDYDKILEINKFFYPALKGRGIAYYNSRKYDEAIRDFNEYLEYEQRDPSIYYHRGMAKMYNAEVYGACIDFLSSSEMGYDEADKAIKKYCD